MMVITVEIWPGGDQAKARVVGIATLENMGEVAPIGNYRCEFITNDERTSDKVNTGIVEGYDRLQHFWHLVRAAIENTFGIKTLAGPTCCGEQYFRCRKCGEKVD